jgi:hypothetical protein
VPTLESARGIAPAWAALPELEPLPARLIACWPLDEATPDTAVDTSGRERDCRASGTVRCEGHDGKGGRQFDGNTYLESPGLGSHEALSISLWVKPDTLSNRWNPLLFCHDGQSGALHFSLLEDGSPNVAVNTGDWNWTHRSARASLADGKWHHLVLVCDARLGGRVCYFIDGRPVGQAAMGLNQRLDLYGFRIGGWNRWETTPADNFHGAIDDIRIYSGMLSDPQVAELARE